MKDVGVELGEGVGVVRIWEGEDGGDGFVWKRYESVDGVGGGSMVGRWSLGGEWEVGEGGGDVIMGWVGGKVGSGVRKVDKGE